MWGDNLLFAEIALRLADFCQQVFNGGVFFFGLPLLFSITPETEAVLLTKAVGIKQRVDGIAVIFLHPLREACCHDSLGMMRGVNAHDIQQICRTHRPAKLFFHHFVDLAEIRAVAQQLAETGEIREQHAVNKEAGQSLTTIGVLPILLAQATTFAMVSLESFLAANNFYQRHSVDRVKEVHPAEVFRAFQRVGQFADRNG